MERSAESPTATDAITPVIWPSQRRPKRPVTRNAASGSAGMSQTSEITRSSLHLVDLVHVDHRPIAIRREDDAQADRDFGGGDDEHEDDEDAAALVDRAVLPRERDEGEVRRVQHELHAHEDDHSVAPNENARAPGEKQHGGHRDVGAEWNGHRRRRIAASSGSSRLVSTIAPTIAARRRTDAISNGNAKSVKTLVASAGRSPPPGRGGPPVNETVATMTIGTATAATKTAASGVCL